jgi:ADP-ribosylglycohydrolase
VPEAIIAFLESTDFESAVRNAIFLGGDADTQACIAGGIAEAFYGGVPADVASAVQTRLESAHLEVLRLYSDLVMSRQK